MAPVVEVWDRTAPPGLRARRGPKGMSGLRVPPERTDWTEPRARWDHKACRAIPEPKVRSVPRVRKDRKARWVLKVPQVPQVPQVPRVRPAPRAPRE